MNRFAWSLFVLAILCLVHCQSNNDSSNQSDQPLLEEVMPGTWEAVSIYVKVNSVNNQTDSSYIFEIYENDWGPKLGVKPVKHYYESDRNYSFESRTIVDSLINRTRGKWFVNGDSIRIVTPVATYEYEVLFDGATVTLESLLDWDGDGVFDDEYTGKQRKISRYTE